MIVWLGVPVLLAAGLFLWAHAAGQTPAGAPSFPHTTMAIEHQDGQRIGFNIEVAATPDEQTYGLMFRRSLAPDAGMLFIFDPPRMVSFWMKNTYISLDMLFVRANGTIEKIVTHAEPLNLKPIPSDEPVKGVVEIGAGVAAKDGIQLGDKLIYPGFSGP